MLGGGAGAGDEIKEEVVIERIWNGIEGGEGHIVPAEFIVKGGWGGINLCCKAINWFVVAFAVIFDDGADVYHDFYY